MDCFQQVWSVFHHHLDKSKPTNIYLKYDRVDNFEKLEV